MQILTIMNFAFHTFLMINKFFIVSDMDHRPRLEQTDSGSD
jgi:hypothetical protein